jgi:glycosidase
MNKFFAILLFISFQSFAQTNMYPPNWFTGMQDTTLQLIIHQTAIGEGSPSITSGYDGFKVVSVSPTLSKDYVLLECVVSNTCKPGMVKLNVNGKKKQVLAYELKPKQAKPQTLQGNDFVYLLMPDRFANGDVKNDVVPSMQEKVVNRSDQSGRHGGDLKGITDQLSYLKELGVTTLWLTPFQENNEKQASYHGYAITNHYKVDPRYGSLNDYLKLRNESRKQNMKWVLDLVFNHIGDQHWLYTDKPFDSVVHTFKEFTRTNYRANTLMDPYGSKIDQKLFTEGWFDHHMPDLNLDNPILARYMTQHTLWWIETSMADGIRIDTYSYPEQAYMQQWYRQVIREYPSLSVFGEIWEHAVPLQTYFVPKDLKRDAGMQNVLDFQFCFAIDDAVMQPDGWTEGVSKLYYTLSQDYLYSDPYHHVVFLDNHDLDRFFATVNYDVKKMKAALSILFTTRGIPSVFYGTEIGMRKKGHDGLRREDFPGGWSTDSVNKFMAAGRTAEEQEIWNHISKLAKWRQTAPAINGKLMQFIPEKGVYVYFRYTDTQKVMVVFNSSKENRQLNLSRFNEQLQQAQSGKDIVTGKTVTLTGQLDIPSGEVLIVEVQ